MRIIFVNLHINWMLVRNSAVLIFKNSAAVKHAYFLKYLIENPDIEVCNFINDKGFSLYPHGGHSFDWLWKKCAVIEQNYVFAKNGFDRKKIKTITNVAEIRHDDIILFYNLMQTNYNGLGDVNAFKVACMIHYGGDSSQYDRIKAAGVNCFMCEVNLQKTSELFRRYSTLNLPWVVHPFVFADRFQNINPFKNRKNKCFSTGTITYKNEKEFLEVYGDPCDQPARKFTKDNPEYFKDTVDSYSSDYLEDDTVKSIKPSDNSVIKLYKRIYNKTHIGKQKKYFSFNMVEKFNEYKMHLVGEEILGVPGIGFVEGMACGSAYIGLDSSMYRDYGLIPGVHYIAYDGTKEGLRQTVEYWQRPENQEELEQIARTGCDFVRKNFCGPIVAEKLLENLIMEQRNWNSLNLKK